MSINTFHTQAKKKQEMSYLVPSEGPETPHEAGVALLNVINQEKVTDVLWFTFKNKISVVLFAVGMFLFLVFLFLRMTRKL